MMTVRLICIGKLKEKYLSDACKEYQKRLGAFCKLELLELPERAVRRRQGGGEAAAFHVEDDLPPSAGEGHAVRTDLPGVFHCVRRKISQITTEFLEGYF